MEVGWNPYGALGVGVGLMAVVLGVMVFAHGRRSDTSLRITALLMSEGLSVAFATGLGFFMLAPEGAIAARLTGEVVMVAVPAAQLLIIGTLDTPLGRPFRGRRPVIALSAVTLFGAASVFLWPGFWVVGHEPGVLAPHRVTNGPGLGIVMFATMLAATYSLVANIHAWRRSKEPVRRQRAKAFAMAYGIRDLALLFLGSIWWASSELADLIGFPLTVGVYVPVLAYGFLRGQLFDIDLRLRRAATRGVAITMVVGLYFLVLQGTGAVLATRMGDAVALATVALAAFAVVPLHKGVNRLADMLVPMAVDIDARKLAVYRQALAESVAADGRLSRASHGMLRRLRAQLGLTDRDHHVVLEAIMAARADASTNAWSRGHRALGRYEIVEPIGVRGRTWLATSGSKRFVVKQGPAVTREKAVLQVRHRNLVRLVEAGHEDGRSVLVLAHAGRALSEVLQTGPMKRPEWENVARDVLAGLAALHDKDIIHGDLKPSNVILADDGTARLADFDIASVPGLDITLGAHPDEMPVGTLRYMSPEQARGRPLSAASDIFSAGATLFEALTGRTWLPVVAGESAPELRQRAARGRMPPRQVVEDEPLNAWFLQALSPQAGQRFASVEDMERALAAALATPAKAATAPRGQPATAVAE